MEFDDHTYFLNPYSGEEEENNEDLGESEECNKGFGEEEEHNEDLGESEVSSEDFSEEDEYNEGLGYEGEDYEDVPNDNVNLSNDNDETPSEPNVFGNLPFSIDFVAGNNSHNDLLNSTNSLRGDPLQEPSVEQRSSDSKNSNPRNGNNELVTVSCLLCINYVHLNCTPEEPAVIKRRKERLQNFVKYSGIHLELPDQCTKNKCPLCNQCKQKVDKMWKINKAIKDLVKSVSVNLSYKHVFGDSFSSNLLTPSAEAEKFNHFPNAIRELFCEERRQDAALRERDELNSSGLRPIIITKVQGGVGLTPPSSVASPNLSTSNDAGTENTMEFNHRPTVAVNVEANQEQKPDHSDSHDGFDVVQMQQRNVHTQSEHKKGKQRIYRYTANKRRTTQGAHRCRNCVKPFSSRNALFEHIGGGNCKSPRGILTPLQKEKILSNPSKLSHRRSHTTKPVKQHNIKNFSTSSALSAPSTSAALVESETRKRTQVGEKSSNAGLQQPTPSTTRFPPPRLGTKHNYALRFLKHK
ncbi:unnamed protein product [Orchesella dallaii]|uniref:C2H2-type domain-containing protein n=1 Tax=Orchesella dallaii TaxID=48710 RepID=A0ABP1RIJ2_9HEXA